MTFLARTRTGSAIRQTYYFGSECEQEDGLPFLNSLLMASYNDISTRPPWGKPPGRVRLKRSASWMGS